MTRVLVVDDEPQILRALRINLRARQLRRATAADGAERPAGRGRRPPDLVVLDLGLPDIDGVDVIRDAARLDPGADHRAVRPRRTAPTRSHALDAGADDYVTKPFSLDELLARIRAVTRRPAGPTAPGASRIGRYTVDLADRTATAATGDAASQLTRTEWQLLEVLARSPGKLVSQRSCCNRSGDPPTEPRPTTCGST